MADVSSTAQPIEDYVIPAGCRDELLDADGVPWPHAAELIATLQRLGPEALAAAGKRRDAIFMQQGITFEVAGSDGERRTRSSTTSTTHTRSSARGSSRGR
jgi:uncharacterized circularly permuted ATP-grasp superfamily protein